MKGPWVLLALSILICVLVGSFGLIVPISALIIHAFSESVQSSDSLGFFSASVLRVVRFTVEQALLCTCLAVAIGTPLGLGLGRVSGRRGARLARGLLTIPYGVPSVVVGLTGVIWLGRRGWFGFLDWGYSAKAVILAHIFLNIPWVTLLVAEARAQVPRNELESAQSSGAGAFARLRWIIAPRIEDAVLMAALQVQSLCVMSFGIVQLLGGGPPVDTLETSIYSHIRMGQPDLVAASRFAFWQCALTLPLWLWISGRRRALRSRVNPPSSERPARSAWVWVGVGTLFIFPYFAVFTDLQWPPSGMIGGPVLVAALLLSIEIAVLSSILALAVGCAAEVISDHAPPGIKRTLLTFFSLPSGISVLVLGLGASWAYPQWFDPAQGSLSLIVLLQGVIGVPLVLRSLLPLIDGTEREMLLAARSLGAGPVRAFFQIEWPRYRNTTYSLCAMLAACSLGELGAVSLFYSEKMMTLPLLAVRLSTQYRFAEAKQVSALLLLLAILLGVLSVQFKSESA